MHDQWLAPYLQELTDYGLEIVISKAEPPIGSSDWLPDLNGTVAIFANGNDDVTAAVIAAASDLKVICRTGVGFDRVDVDAAAQQRVPVTTTPGSNSEAVADFAMGMILACARQIPRLNAALKAGAWQPRLGVDVHSKTLGIAGLGRIGQAVARRARAFDMRLLGVDPIVSQEQVTALGVEKVSFDTLLAESDFITLHMPSLPETSGFIGKRELEAMWSTAYLINTARGPLVDERALVDALREKQIAGAALDVFGDEPRTDSPFAEFENVIVSPHIAGATVESTAMMAEAAVDNAIAVISGKWPREIVVNGVYSDE
jgi:D-3-phosphoglycerate dehydrogenase